jgi:hypothetical protein
MCFWEKVSFLLFLAAKIKAVYDQLAPLLLSTDARNVKFFVPSSANVPRELIKHSHVVGSLNQLRCATTGPEAFKYDPVHGNGQQTS